MFNDEEQIAVSYTHLDVYKRQVRDFRPADFHQLARRIVGVSSHDAVFILFPQGAAAHHLPFRHPAVAARTLNPSVFLVVFVIRRIRQRPGSIDRKSVV